MSGTRTRFLPEALALELRRAPWRALGATFIAIAMLGWLSLLGWQFSDPSLNNATAGAPDNWLGFGGAATADILLQVFGLASIFLLAPVAVLGWQIMHGLLPKTLGRRLIQWLFGTEALAAAFSLMPIPQGWPLKSGLGGAAGDLGATIVLQAGGLFSHPLAQTAAGSLTALAGFWLLLRASAITARDLALLFQVKPHDAAAGLGFEAAQPVAPTLEERLQTRFTSWIAKLSPRSRALAALPKAPREFWMTPANKLPSQPVSPLQERAAAAQSGTDDGAAGDWTSAFANWNVSSRGGGRRDDGGSGRPGHETPAQDPFDASRMEPFFGPGPSIPAPAPEGQADGGEPPVSGFKRITGRSGKSSHDESRRLLTRLADKALSEARHAAEPDAALPDVENQAPPLSLLAAPKAQDVRPAAGDPALMQKAAMLMEVLGDFGVKGRITGIYPGPVITLFELEPARGTKSSRVVGLADDIARSMSAVSARVAVVPGRDAIGIELPNERRELVSLRAVMEAPVFQMSQAALPLALGKTIGGEPVVVDLARMPHLLIAGTTGSGKSVGINTMILSLLYRLPASQCKFIMIDPKMLELSVYDGIPHLLAPVVTDPKKAVAALKWTVREMNERYEKMCKLGVRNVSSYNAKAAAAQLRGQPLRRRMQTGFDPRTGEPVYEEEAFENDPMPYIVVVIDEMADLMMVAGKEIEFAVQRLSQMARAAGIHLVMATQRPSVDVITGTIKANFPSRISFQVTSKIDSRTIIGEMGAEQLLGAGDMLYMAAGGRIMRAHGPFVSDEEVERVAAYLKAQGVPDYRDDILESAEEGDDDESGSARGSDAAGDLYDQAVAIVLRDRKPTTSYLQRRLGIGYNRAASLIERMEEDGLIGAPNRTGRREILGDHAAT